MADKTLDPDAPSTLYRSAVPVPGQPGRLFIPITGQIVEQESITSLFRVVSDPRRISESIEGRIPSHENWIVQGLFVVPDDRRDADDLGTVCLHVNADLRFFEQPVNLLMRAWDGLVAPLGPDATPEQQTERLQLFRAAIGCDAPSTQLHNTDHVRLEFSHEACRQRPPKVVLIGLVRKPLGT